MAIYIPFGRISHFNMKKPLLIQNSVVYLPSEVRRYRTNNLKVNENENRDRDCAQLHEDWPESQDRGQNPFG